ncbi:Cell division integral membrane protein, YggT and half-length relatives [hydrothermal vent metagenome]|uniref:Cell division integral membrane protein, YggT and half-length relatives n=2 Tax=hydrothermal vent metagenome TaxID=652676 RepID=A0A3B0S1H6_9ZZZZ
MPDYSLFQALLFYFISPILGLISFIILVRVILSWLISFQVVNLQNQLVAAIWDISGRVTEPLVRPIRRFVPSMGGLDLSLVVLWLLISFIQSWLIPGLARGSLRLF